MQAHTNARESKQWSTGGRDANRHLCQGEQIVVKGSWGCKHTLMVRKGKAVFRTKESRQWEGVSTSAVHCAAQQISFAKHGAHHPMTPQSRPRVFTE